MAFSFTGDLGCEFGPSTTTSTGQYVQGVSCLGDTRDKNSIGYANAFTTTATGNVNGTPQTITYTGAYGQPASAHGNFAPGINPKQSFIGYMIYDRMWFNHDKYGLTIGGGQINNPGRYLVLVPPINGETAASAALSSPYFSFNPSDPFKAWDTSVTFDYMPRQWLTFRTEYDFRHASVPYWSGHGGVTPPAFATSGTGTNNGSPSALACNDNSAFGAAGGACSGGIWQPDLRRAENLIDVDLMVKF
jgi:hypothetical protein